MRVLVIPLVLATMAASTKVVLQWCALREAKAEAIALHESEANAAQPTEDRAAREELERLRGETQDLLKLRNQVRQLRSELPQLARARAENDRLRQAQQSLGPAPAPASMAPTPPGFTSREGLVESGLATPEAVVQSFFRAMRDGDVPRFLQCISPEFRDRDMPENMDANQMAKFGEKLREGMDAFANFRIVERKEISPDQVLLGVQSSTGPSIMRLGLHKVGNDWLLDKPY